MANINLSSEKDRERLKKKVIKLKEKAWTEMNLVSGIDPKFKARQMVFIALDELLKKLSQ